MLLVAVGKMKAAVPAGKVPLVAEKLTDELAPGATELPNLSAMEAVIFVSVPVR